MGNLPRLGQEELLKISLYMKSMISKGAQLKEVGFYEFQGSKQSYPCFVFSELTNPREALLILGLQSDKLFLCILNEEQKRKLGRFQNSHAKKEFHIYIKILDFLKDCVVDSLEKVPGDRRIQIFFQGPQRPILQLDLIPARPNVLLLLQDENQDSNECLQSIAFQLRNPLPMRFLNVSELETKVDQQEFIKSQDFIQIKESQERLAESILNLEFDQLIRQASIDLRGALQKEARTLKRLEGELKQANGWESYRLKGEQIKAQLWRLDPHEKMNRIHFEDLSESIELDSSKTILENVELCFKNSRKWKRALEDLGHRIQDRQKIFQKLGNQMQDLQKFRFDGMASLVHLRKFLSQIELISSPSELPVSSKQLSKKDKIWKLSDLRHFLSQEGLEIWIGRNHKENEFLVMRCALGQDIWLHLKSRPGAHGIIRVPRNRSASLETLLDASQLVAHYSGISEGEKVEVDYAFRKHVKRVSKKGEQRFDVSYTQNKSITTQVDPARIRRLLSTS